MDKLENSFGPVSRGHILFRMLGGYNSMMDNSCKLVDGSIYKAILPETDDLSIRLLRDSDMDYRVLLWEDTYVYRRNRGNVTLTDRNI